ncbi:hypothetical protein BJY59DRAFT_105536 [Rhodotorula toruloides]
MTLLWKGSRPMRKLASLPTSTAAAARRHPCARTTHPPSHQDHPRASEPCASIDDFNREPTRTRPRAVVVERALTPFHLPSPPISLASHRTTRTQVYSSTRHRPAHHPVESGRPFSRRRSRLLPEGHPASSVPKAPLSRPLSAFTRHTPFHPQLSSPLRGRRPPAASAVRTEEGPPLA